MYTFVYMCCLCSTGLFIVNGVNIVWEGYKWLTESGNRASRYLIKRKNVFLWPLQLIILHCVNYLYCHLGFSSCLFHSFNLYINCMQDGPHCVSISLSMLQVVSYPCTVKPVARFLVASFPGFPPACFACSSKAGESLGTLLTWVTSWTG